MAKSLIQLWPLYTAGIFTVILALQYPLQTTFPIGGDAADYIHKSQTILQDITVSPITSLKETLNSAYPAFTASFLLSALVPIPWPDRFIWWMILGHLAAAFFIARLLYRLGGLSAAATGVAIWGLTTTTVNTHFEAATLAQLWSLTPLLIFLERTIAQKTLTAILALFLTLFTHPITGLLLIASTAITIPIWITLRPILTEKAKHTAKFIALTTTMLVVISIFILIRKQNTLHLIDQSNGFNYLANFVRSHLGPFVILAPFGFCQLLTKLKRQPLIVPLFLSLTFITILTFFNHLLNISVWSNRFITYGVLLTTLYAGLALPLILQSLFPSITTRRIIIFLLFLIVGSLAWQVNDQVYSRYESGSRYLRLHPDEIAAINWADQNLPTPSRLVTTNTTRHAEWIPVLTNHHWQVISSSPDYFTGLISTDKYTEFSNNFFFFFTKIEDPPSIIDQLPEHFEVIFNNDAATIVRLRTP